MTDLPPRDQPAAHDGVIFLHGIFRTARSMEAMRRFMAAQGYMTLNIDYPSTKMPIARLAELVLPRIQQFCAQVPGRVHFVGYSMGGLLIRALLAMYRPDNLGRVVMFGPPNRGSEVADCIQDWRLYRWLYGPAGQQLTTAANPVPGEPVPYELGVLAGCLTIDPICTFIIGGVNDGKVSVESTKLPGMKAHRVIRATHTFFPLNREAWRLTLQFIKTGAFDAPSTAAGIA